MWKTCTLKTSNITERKILKTKIKEYMHNTGLEDSIFKIAILPFDLDSKQCLSKCQQAF